MRFARTFAAALVAATALLGAPASANVPGGAATYAVAINQTTGLAYVGAACSCGGSVVVIDTATDEVVATVTTVATPTQIAVDEERDQIFAAHFDTASVSVIDGGTNSVSATLSFGGLGLAVNPARDLLYATLGTGGMAVYDLNTLAHLTTVPVAPGGANWWGVAVNPVTDRIYVENLPGAVEVLDGATYALLADIGIFGEARFGVTVDPGANLVYVPRYVSNGRVHVIDGATNTLRSDFAAAGSFPYALALDVAAQRLYSADRGSGTVTVFSTAGTLTRIETISVGGTPTGLALPMLGPTRLYVTNSLTDTVLVLALNAPPAVTSVTVTPDAPRTNDLLTASVVAADPDGDALTYSYQWIKNGLDLAGETSETLDLSVPGNGDRSDVLAVRVSASDGSATSEPVTSNSVTVTNSTPAAAVTISPDPPHHRDLLTADVTASDADGDAVLLTYVWRVNDEVRRTITTTSTTDQFDLAEPRNGRPHDIVSVTVTPNDGSGSGADTTDSVTVVPGQ